MKAQYRSPQIEIEVFEHVTLLEDSSDKTVVDTGDGNKTDVTDKKEDASGGRAKPMDGNNWSQW